VDLINFTVAQFQNFFLVLVRVASIFIIAPFFSSRNIPPTLKIGFSVLVALIIFPIIQAKSPLKSWEMITFFSEVLKQILVGLVIGFVAILIFVAVQLGGQIIDIQIGYGIVNVVDPQTGMQVSLVGQFIYLLALLVFLAVNGHHLVISALAQSFELVPLFGVGYSGELAGRLDRLFSDIFVIGLKVAAPIMAITFLMEVAMGLVARTVPQINVFLVGFPLRIGLGLGMIALSMPFFVYIFKGLTEEMYRDMMVILRYL